MRVQAGHHAGDGFGDEFLLVHRLDVVAFDHAKYGRQLLQFFEGQGGHVAARHGLQRHGGEGTGQSTNAEPADDLEFLSHFASTCAVKFEPIYTCKPRGVGLGV